jgi:hypothetical protein
VKHYPEKYKPYQRRNGTIKLRLLKALYGLKEAGKLWNENLSSFLISEGFVRSKLDQAVFYRNEGRDMTTINTHVDDLLITTTNNERIDKLTEKMDAKYGKMKCQTGSMLNYIGSELHITSDKVTVTQTKYTEECLRKFNLWDNPKDTVPAPYTTGDSHAIDDLFMEKQGPKIDKSTYLSYLMSLMYLATNTRPDILLAVSVLATRAEIATQQDLDSVVRVAKYINGTRDRGLILHPKKDLQLEVYADASHAIHDNTAHGKRMSHGGYVIFLGGAHILSKSNKMKMVTDSSTSSELNELHIAVKEAQWARAFLNELGTTQSPTKIYQDNKSTITIATRIPGHKGNTKHLQVKFFYIHDACDNGDIEIAHMPTDHMLADFYTKPQGSIKRFCSIRDIITGHSAPHAI